MNIDTTEFFGVYQNKNYVGILYDGFLYYLDDYTQGVHKISVDKLMSITELSTLAIKRYGDKIIKHIEFEQKMNLI